MSKKSMDFHEFISNSEWSAYAITDGERIVGKIIIRDTQHTTTVCVVDLDSSDAPMYGNANGKGFNRLQKAISGLSFREVSFTEEQDWQSQLVKSGYQVVYIL